MIFFNGWYNIIDKNILPDLCSWCECVKKAFSIDFLTLKRECSVTLLQQKLERQLLATAHDKQVSPCTPSNPKLTTLGDVSSKKKGTSVPKPAYVTLAKMVSII